MGNQASTSEIALFLERAKRLISVGKYDFVPRRKNMQALAKHGLTIFDAKSEILGFMENKLKSMQEFLYVLNAEKNFIAKNWTIQH